MLESDSEICNDGKHFAIDFNVFRYFWIAPDVGEGGEGGLVR